MSAKLPYFQWYPQDCDTDERVRCMDDLEFGFFVRCLNHSWINDGLPGTLEEIALALGRTKHHLTRVWPKVGRCFELTNGRFRNPRQEEERVKAREKSRVRSSSAKSRWDANAMQMHSKSIANGMQKQCYTEPEPESEPKRHTQSRAPLASDQTQTPSARFEEFWALYPRKQHRNQAAQAWCSVVTSAVETQVFACEARYCDSDEVSRGVVLNPEKWLFEQAADGWAGAWPARNGTVDDKEFNETLKRIMR